ncbi:MAG: hypothetical protein MRZ79_20270 [Bacteroidia bacterium]|nr:hypothetical protein [Bacteroidia bacterium]
MILVFGLIWIVDFSFKAKTENISKRIKRWIKVLAIILFFPLILLYLSYLFGLSIDDHYDVKKGTFLWYATMDNQTITEFPVFDVNGKVKYNSIGGDSPAISTGWEIEYTSKTDIKTLTNQIVEYLEKEGYEIKEVEETQFYWKGKNKKNETNQLYSGSNEKGESLDLLVQNIGSGLIKIECSIVY